MFRVRALMSRWPWLLMVSLAATLFWAGLDPEVALLKNDVQGLRYEVADVKMRVAELERKVGVTGNDQTTPTRGGLSEEEIAKRRLKIHMDDPTDPAIKIAPRGFDYVMPDFLIGKVIMASKASRSTNISRSKGSGTNESEGRRESINKANPDDPDWNESHNTGASSNTSRSTSESKRIEHSVTVISGEMINRSKQSYKSANFAITLYDKRKQVLGFGNFQFGYFRSAITLPFRVTVHGVERKKVDSYKVVFINGEKEPVGKPQSKEAKSLEKLKG